MQVNIKKLELVLNPLLAALNAGQYPFNKQRIQMPHQKKNLPKNLIVSSTEHALFLFCLCYYMRGGIDSDTAARALAKLYENIPEIFVPKNGMSENPKKITELLQKVGLGFQSRRIGSYWVENFRLLFTYWDSNPTRLMEDIQTYDDACYRIKNKHLKKDCFANKNSGFFGFQEKMVSMLIYFLTDSGLIKPIHFPPPIDFHVLRIMFAHEILVMENGDRHNYNEKTLALIRHILSEYSQKNCIDPLHLSEVMWIVSRTLCSQHPGNTSNIGKYEHW